MGTRVSAVVRDPNTGPLPKDCVKIEFSETAPAKVEPNTWTLEVFDNKATITQNDIVITLEKYIFKGTGEDKEIIGFTRTVEGAVVESFTVKHGTTIKTYGKTFKTSDEKGISNAVWCLVEEEPEDPDEEDPDDDDDDDDDEDDDEDEDDDDEDEDDEDDDDDDEEDEDDDENPDDEDPDDEDPVDPEDPDNEDNEDEDPDEEEPIEEEPIEEEPIEEEPIEEEPIEEEPEQPEEPIGKEVLEPLPDTSDFGGLGLGLLQLGALALFFTRKREDA